MALDQISPGQTTVFGARFLTEAGVPFAATAAPTWTVRNSAGALIVSGTGAQDGVDPALWTATVTVPSAVPVQSGERFTLSWTARNDGETLRQSEGFTVAPAVDLGFVESDILMPAHSRLSGTLAVDGGYTVTALSVHVSSLEGQTLFEDTVTDPASLRVDQDGLALYPYVSAAPVPEIVPSGVSFRPLVLEFEYALDGEAGYREYHFLYVATTPVLAQIHAVRLIIDRARRRHPNQALNLSDVDIAGYLGQGADLLNGIKPVLTAWTPVSIPAPFFTSLTYAAAYSALLALFHTEGQAAFEFSGQAVSLSVDRTGFIATTMDRLKDHLDSQVPTMKRNWVRAGGTGGQFGVLGLNLGVSTPFADRDVRYDLYRKILFGR